MRREISGAARRKIPPGRRIRLTSSRNAWAALRSRCSIMCELYTISTELSAHGIRRVALANRIFFSAATLANSQDGPAKPLRPMTRRAISSQRASRTVQELSKLIQPSVGVAPHPTFTRRFPLPGDVKFLPLALYRAASRDIILGLLIP